MKKIIIIIIMIFVSPSINSNSYAVEVIDKGAETIGKIKSEGKNVLKSLIRKSLKGEEINKFIEEYVITIDDGRGDGLVTYYFYEKVYKRYKDLEFVSEDKWKISYLDKKLKIYNEETKSTWKIQPGKENIINIKKNISSLGKQIKFSYRSKTDYHVALEEKKIKN